MELASQCVPVDTTMELLVVQLELLVNVDKETFAKAQDHAPPLAFHQPRLNGKNSAKQELTTLTSDKMPIIALTKEDSFNA